MKSECQQNSGASDSPTIYVIDDHPIMRDAIASTIRRLRRDVQISEFSCITEIPLGVSSCILPIAVVLDLNLPDAQGCSGVFHVRKNYPRTSLAVCSASPASEMALQCFAAGADLYIHKGLGAQKLTSALSALLSMGVGSALNVNGNALFSAL
jgi:DNA-binding NarL/FixJ family response regulator